MAQLNVALQDYSTQWNSCPLNWFASQRNSAQIQPNSWVKLPKILSTFCYDEALLLCQHSEFEWVVWIPDYGETILDITEFSLL